MTEQCERFEVDIEKRAHGQLGVEETSALELHLAACERCKAFAVLVGETDSGLKRSAQQVAPARRSRSPSGQTCGGERRWDVSDLGMTIANTEDHASCSCALDGCACARCERLC